jgi:SAM-dependent methyltransferase
MTHTAPSTSRQQRAQRDQEHHEIIASQYERVVNQPRQSANAALFNSARAYLPAARSQMLDIGCGTGQMTRRFGALFGAVTAVDHSAAMLAVARETISATPALFARTTFTEADAFEFADTSETTYDLICAVGFLHHLAPGDLAQILSQLKAKLAPGGRLIMAEPFEFDPHAEPRLAKWWNTPFRAAFQGYTVEAVEPDEAPLNAEFFESKLAAAGLKVLYTRRAWEFFPRFGALVDGYLIRLLDMFARKDGVVGLYVAARA